MQLTSKGGFRQSIRDTSKQTIFILDPSLLKFAPTSGQWPVYVSFACKSGNNDDFIAYLNVKFNGRCLQVFVAYSTFDKALYRYPSGESHEFTSLCSKFVEVMCAKMYLNVKSFWQSYCKNKMVQFFETQCSSTTV